MAKMKTLKKIQPTAVPKDKNPRIFFPSFPTNSSPLILNTIMFFIKKHYNFHNPCKMERKGENFINFNFLFI
jgi:hypothetical protein